LLQIISEQQTVTAAATETCGLPWWDAACPAPSLQPLNEPRAAQSPKGFFLPAAEAVARYGREATTAVETEAAPLVLIGVRACELRARKVLDAVMLGGDFKDPAYERRRQQTTVIACDCLTFAETCFCPKVGGRPYATEDFDINLTPIDDGFIAEVATEKGHAFLGDAKFPEADSKQLARRDELRRQAIERLQEQNAQFDFSADDQSQPALPEGDSPRWQQFAADCVECGACTNICPTCHCFYLYDQVANPEEFERVRNWDSCLFGTYHRMAGGENVKLSPQPILSSRLANRVLHKFVYSPQQYDLLGCVGCGRCIDACLGAIDIRQVVAELGE